MYIVSRSNDEKYGNVIAICRSDAGELSPFIVAEEAKKEKRLWAQEGTDSRFMVDHQILTPKELEKWARDEYKNLPKCQECCAILNGEVFTNAFSSNACFCSQSCGSRDYHRQVEHMSDYEECDL